MRIARVIRVLGLCLAMVTVSTVAARADPIIWTLLGVTFSDTATASGSFTYNPATNAYSNWNISVTPGPFLTVFAYQPGVNFGFVGIHNASQVDFVAFPPATSGRYIRLTFLSPLTNSGGTIALRTDNSGYECNNCTIFRYITGGSVTGVAAVPEPSTFVLLAGGMLVGFVIRRLSAGRTS